MRPRPEPREAANTAPRAALTAFSTSGFQTLAPRIGCNPEQLFAAAWSASLESAIALAARQRKIIFPGDRPTPIDPHESGGGGRSPERSLVWPELVLMDAVVGMEMF